MKMHQLVVKQAFIFSLPMR